MASLKTLAPTWPGMPVSRAFPQRAMRPISVHVIARFAFWTLFLLSLSNALWILIAYLRYNLQDEEFRLGIYPVTFFISAALVFAFSKGARRSPILLAGWAFWLIYFLGGFLGSEQITATYFRQTLEVTIKPWMSLVGLPWLALRAISPDKFPRLIRVTVLVTCVGAVLATMQVFMPGFMQQLNVEPGRGSGLWLNPNSSGVMCAIVLFLSMLHPFEWRGANWLTRLVLIVGIAVSFSRAAMLVLLVAWVVYGVTAGRFRSLLISGLAFGLFIVSMLVFLDTIDALSPHHEKRLGFVRSFLQGDWRADEGDNRTELWRLSYQAIVDKNGLLFGLGHGSMVVVADGLQPHNNYLYILGNSGLLALLALLAWMVVLAQQAWKCGRRETRASILAIAAIFAVLQMFDSALFDRPPTGAIMACIVLAVCYDRAPVFRSNRRLRLPVRHVISPVRPSLSSR